jgi:hypothetical protein
MVINLIHLRVAPPPPKLENPPHFTVRLELDLVIKKIPSIHSRFLNSDQVGVSCKYTRWLPDQSLYVIMNRYRQYQNMVSMETHTFGFLPSSMPVIKRLDYHSPETSTNDFIFRGHYYYSSNSMKVGTTFYRPARYCRCRWVMVATFIIPHWNSSHNNRKVIQYVLTKFPMNDRHHTKKIIKKHRSISKFVEGIRKVTPSSIK